jgi:hypothetical protein
MRHQQAESGEGWMAAVLNMTGYLTNIRNHTGKCHLHKLCRQGQRTKVRRRWPFDVTSVVLQIDPTTHPLLNHDTGGHEAESCRKSSLIKLIQDINLLFSDPHTRRVRSRRT